MYAEVSNAPLQYKFLYYNQKRSYASLFLTHTMPPDLSRLVQSWEDRIACERSWLWSQLDGAALEFVIFAFSLSLFFQLSFYFWIWFGSTGENKRVR